MSITNFKTPLAVRAERKLAYADGKLRAAIAAVEAARTAYSTAAEVAALACNADAEEKAIFGIERCGIIIGSL